MDSAVRELTELYDESGLKGPAELRVSSEADGLKKRLQPWRHVGYHALQVLRWKEDYHRLALFGTHAVMFVLIWYSQMSSLTVLCLFAALVNLIDGMSPVLNSNFHDSRKWSAEEEKEFDSFCSCIMTTKHFFKDSLETIKEFRREMPHLFAAIVGGTFVILAVIFQQLNGILLAYFCTGLLLALPHIHSSVSFCPTLKLYREKILIASRSRTGTQSFVIG